MEPLTYIDRGKRKGMTVDEFMALDFPSDSDDGLDFDNFSDEDPTVNLKNLESSDSDSEPETTLKNLTNSSGIIENQVHPSIAEVSQPTASNKKTNTGKCQILWKKQSANFSGESFLFARHNALPQSILQLSTPYQFFKNFLLMKLCPKLQM
jgi:hypothetical protein